MLQKPQSKKRLITDFLENDRFCDGGESNLCSTVIFVFPTFHNTLDEQSVGPYAKGRIITNLFLTQFFHFPLTFSVPKPPSNAWESFYKSAIGHFDRLAAASDVKSLFEELCYII